MKKLLFLAVFPLFAFQCSENSDANLNDELAEKNKKLLIILIVSTVLIVVIISLLAQNLVADQENICCFRAT